jgi:LysR family transcriptional regulator, low CO2-responsive transcriptional regulator
VSTHARLRALVELADTGSVRAAARRLVVTEASVSAALTALSAEVGVRLTDRDGRGVRLTPAGLRYVGYARRILGLHAEALLAARGEADAERGTIRLAAVTTAGEHLIPGLLASFRARYPEVSLGLEVAPRGVVWPMLDHHEVDLVVAGRPPETAEARVRAVHPNTLVVVGAARDGFDPARATWLLREPASGIRATTLALLRSLELDPPVLTLGSHGAVVAAAAAGLGVTLVSRQAVTADLRAGTLVELGVPGTPMDRPWHVVTQPAPTATTELLVSHLLADRTLGWSLPRSESDPARRVV